MNISVPSEWKVIVSLFKNKIVKMLSHIVNIPVHSVSIIWCKLWKQFGWQLDWNAEGCASYVCHISFQSAHLHINVCGILIERDCFEFFELLRIWSISQYLAVPFNHCKAMIDKMVHNSGPYLIWYVTLSVASSASSSVLPLSAPFHHASLLLFFLSSIDPDRFLDVHSSSEFVTLVLSSVYSICFPI